MRARSLLAVLAVAALGLTACGGSTEGASDKSLTMVLGADPGNLDPHFTSLSVTYQVDSFLYDSLVNIDKNGKLVPGLAQKWKGSTTKATFTLRKGVTCSDGTSLTASTVAQNINFVGDPKNKSSRIGVFVPPGAKATANDKARTVTVTVPSPDAFLARSVGRLQIVCKKGMKDRSMLKRGADGTGMFTLTDAVPGDHYTLTRRTDYAWGPHGSGDDEAALPDTLVLKVVTNEATSANLMLSGGANIARFVGPDQKRLKTQGLFERDNAQPTGVLWFNEASGHPGADESVRRALTQALDLDQAGKAITSGTGQTSKGMVAPGLGPCDADLVSGNLPEHDVATAKSALDAAGWKPGPDGIRVKDGTKLSLRFYYPTSYGPTMEAGAELLRQQWKAIGADVTLKGMSDTQAGTVILGGKGSWDATLLPFGITLPSQIAPFVSGPTPPDGQNFASIENAGYTQHVKKASSMAGTAGCSEWGQAEQSLYKHVDLVVFVDSVSPTFGKGATFELSAGSVDPTSIRVSTG